MLHSTPTKDKAIRVTTMFRQPLSQFHTGKCVPMLRISGDWLGALGFSEGKKVIVAAEHGRLVLTVEE